MNSQMEKAKEPENSFDSAFPCGVQLSEEVLSLMESKCKNRDAITFDEVTLEDKPSDFHPADVR